jgi:hypothetical protein
MRIEAILLILILTFSCFAYAENYDTEIPQSPAVENKKSTSLEVTGITYDVTPVAIVNDLVVKEGDEIEGWKVEKIEQNLVKFKCGNEIITEHIKGKKSTADFGKIDQSLEQKVAYRKVEELYFHISKNLGAITGYVIFRDKNGNQCTANGRLSLEKKVTYYEEESEIIGFDIVEKQVPKTRIESLKSIIFSSDDFKNMKLLSGETVFALPISIESTELKKGDIVILKWRDFKIEKEIYEF